LKRKREWHQSVVERASFAAVVDDMAWMSSSQSWAMMAQRLAKNGWRASLRIAKLYLWAKLRPGRFRPVFGLDYGRSDS
jgi:hypothetical protein